MMRTLVDAYPLSLIPLSEEVAILSNLPVVTTDRRFRDYGIQVIA